MVRDTIGDLGKDLRILERDVSKSLTVLTLLHSPALAAKWTALHTNHRSAERTLLEIFEGNLARLGFFGLGFRACTTGSRDKFGTLSP
jgi:hypothetical protein